MSETLNKSTVQELSAGARRHYEELSGAACDWSSIIPQAIDAWERERLAAERRASDAGTHPEQAEGERERLVAELQEHVSQASYRWVPDTVRSLVGRLAAALRSAPPGEPTHKGEEGERQRERPIWFVERDANGVPEWYAGEAGDPFYAPCWTRDANNAAPFPDKAAAESRAEYLMASVAYPVVCKATEHLFVAPAAPRCSAEAGEAPQPEPDRPVYCGICAGDTGRDVQLRWHQAPEHSASLPQRRIEGAHEQRYDGWIYAEDANGEALVGDTIEVFPRDYGHDPAQLLGGPLVPVALLILPSTGETP